LHSPAETEESNVFTLKLNSDFSGIDLVRQQYGVRTTNPENKIAVELGAWSGYVGTLPIVVSIITSCKFPGIFRSTLAFSNVDTFRKRNSRSTARSFSTIQNKYILSLHACNSC
jgi:hypothetical protein